MKQQYEIQALSRVQKLTQKRKNLHITQIELAFKFEVSLRTIQNFENYQSLNNAYLFWAYENYLV